jgi:rSAM/selenodomain-associated transferase 1
MLHGKKLGIFCKVPVAGGVKTRLTPPLTPEQACALYEAFLGDLFGRLEKMKKTGTTVFYAGSEPGKITDLIPDRYGVLPQEGDSLGERLRHAFEALTGSGESAAVVIGSDSPDLPLQYIKRAFLKLKHKDVVLGPSSDGGYYLVGARSVHPGIFEDINWGSDRVFGQTVDRIRAGGLSLALLPVWYDVDTPPSLELLRSMIRARRIEGSGSLPKTEAVLRGIPVSPSL